MPIHRGVDRNGTYYQWGSQARYYYTPRYKKGRELAYEMASKQSKTIAPDHWDENLLIKF
jgi:hypothetical protein